MLVEKKQQQLNLFNMPPLKSIIHENEPPSPNDQHPIQSNERRSFTSVQYSQKLLINLNKLRSDSRFCDVDIIAGETVFNAHRAVLSASSPYFEAMFRPELGLSEGNQKSVKLYSISPEILQMLIDFIYTGKVEINQV